MTAPRSVVLDNEAVSALLDPGHTKHRRMLARIEVAASRNLVRAGAVELLVPTSVRVEAGWDRQAAGAAPVNRLRANDAPLDTATANQAARLRRDLAVSVADAHVGAVLAAAAKPVAVITSDVADLRRIAGHLGVQATIVAV